jgi:hypothetical protein
LGGSDRPWFVHLLIHDFKAAIIVTVASFALYVFGPEIAITCEYFIYRQHSHPLPSHAPSTVL